MKKWTLTVQEDASTGEGILEFPEDLLLETGWVAGDTLVWKIDTDGTVSLSKKIDNNTIKSV